MKIKVIRFLSICSLILVCIGCTHINTQITTYYNPTMQFSGKTYAFYPIKELHQETDNQYDYFTDFISQNLASQGMIEKSLVNADYGVILTYWVGQGQEKTDYYPIIGQTGSRIESSYTRGNAYSYGGYGYYSSETKYNTTPIHGVVGMLPHRHTEYPYFIHFFIMKKIDLPKGKPLYHGILISRGSNVPPSIVFNTMLKGYMDIFPGVNGETRTVSTYISEQ